MLHILLYILIVMIMQSVYAECNSACVRILSAAAIKEIFSVFFLIYTSLSMIILINDVVASLLAIAASSMVPLLLLSLLLLSKFAMKKKTTNDFILDSLLFRIEKIHMIAIGPIHGIPVAHVHHAMEQFHNPILISHQIQIRINEKK